MIYYQVNPTRLFVLGARPCAGRCTGTRFAATRALTAPSHGFEVKPGSLYAAIHRLQAEGLIEPVRTEQQGNLPARTVYAITAEGRKELRALRAEALREYTRTRLPRTGHERSPRARCAGFFADRRRPSRAGRRSSPQEAGLA